MKYAVIILFMLAFLHTEAQREPRFKYNYTFKIDIHTCPSTILKDTLVATPGESSLEIELRDCNGKGIPFVTVTIKGKDSIAKGGFTDSAGKTMFTNIPGTYSTTAAAIGFQQITKTLSINNDSKHHVAITLAYSQPLDIYDIRSKIPLSAKKIEEIKACVEQNPSNPFKCGFKNSYTISMEI